MTEIIVYQQHCLPWLLIVLTWLGMGIYFGAGLARLSLPTTAHIVELLPLIVNQGHHHVPIVDADGRFVGMVFQSRLLSTLFNTKGCRHNP